MDRRRFLASLGPMSTVTLAGCGDVLDGEPAGPFPNADWRDGDGLDVETLATSHIDAAVDAGGVTLYSTARTGHDGESEPSPWLPDQTYESRYDLANERQLLRQAVTESDETEVTELYVTPEEALFREQLGSEVTYDRQPLDGSAGTTEETMRVDALVGIRVPQGSAGDDVVYEGLENWEPTFEASVDVDDEPAARFAADSFDGSRPVPATVETASATVDILESGFVPRIEQRWEGSHDGTTASVDVDIEYRDRGVSVSEPDWVEEARTETTD